MNSHTIQYALAVIQKQMATFSQKACSAADRMAMYTATPIVGAIISVPRTRHSSIQHVSLRSQSRMWTLSNRELVGAVMVMRRNVHRVHYLTRRFCIVLEPSVIVTGIPVTA